MKEDLIKDLNKENQYLDKFPKIENLSNLSEEDKNIIWKYIEKMVATNTFWRGNDRKIAARKKYIENNVYRKLNLESKRKKKKKKQAKKESILKEKNALIEKLYEILILDKKNTLGNIINFINTYGQVKDNEEEFIKYCIDISRKLYISRDYDTKAPNLSREKKSNEEDEDNKSNPIEDQIKQKDLQDKDESELEKQQNKEKDFEVGLEQNEKTRIIKKYFYYILKEIENKYSKYINLFIISYFINKNILDRNINKIFEPTNMDRLFYKEDKLYLYLIKCNRTDLNNRKDEIEYKINNYDLSSKKNIKEILDNLCLRPKKGKEIKNRTNLVDNKTVEQIYSETEEEKEKILKEKLRKFLFSEIFKTSKNKSKEEILNGIIDPLYPLSFWKEFHSCFQYKIEEANYYSLLKSVNQRADRRKEKMRKILDNIFNTLENNNYKFDSKEDREDIEELDNTTKQKIIKFIKLSIPDKNIRNNEEKGKTRQKDLVNKLKEHKIKKCDGYKEGIVHLVTENKVLTEEEKKELDEHLEHCNNCAEYFKALASGNEYINEELEKGKSFPYDKKYDVIEPIKTLTHNEELINYYVQEFINEPNSYTQKNLILAYIKTGNIEKATEFYNKSMEEMYKIINNKEIKNG